LTDYREADRFTTTWKWRKRNAKYWLYADCRDRSIHL